ncbi:aminopeptidase P family protein [Parerythrobacter jejuensis]|uniref:M24 family metallopeptidase n=1 Tax=Parerythrobacter jejuensis TaxID=795812 RepID=A0A845APP5_9SPHN|nr:aminopeptidase P family protein [Parerythrobacter jejuensis]MXP31163.1 M24 family metallopeptidase [Parerythrobacter jejuensis]MXP33923.1 M24 family metallopeptidase [Parerythrobacter jejuensis]
MLMQTHEARLTALREELKKRALDGFVIPISDEHMSEYVGEYAQRLGWLTGFGGSAGSAAVMADRAAIFVDGRYTVQVRDQVEERLFEYQSVPATSPVKWLAANARQGMKIGYDSWLHSRGWAKKAERMLADVGAELVPVDGNPLDAVWQDRPEPSAAVATIQTDDLAGRSSADKRGEVAQWLKDKKLDAAVISALDSVAWLLNMRGTDVSHTPVALSYVVAHEDGTADLFIAGEKVTPELRQHLGNAVTIRERDEFEGALKELSGKRVAVDPEYGVAAISLALEQGGATPVSERDPTILAKAVKNPVEVQGHRDAQAIDGVAVCKYLHWLGQEAPKGTIDELTAAAKLLEFRQQYGDLRDTSFDTISAAAGHAALPHYKVDDDTNIPIPPSSIYLCDSGGQYPAGTTDITRTIWVGPGEPTAEMKDRFTRVLKGHIAIAMATFPAGTNGGQLDSLARQFLWQAGTDYAHGTGHGVGSFLSVHEGPQRIAKTSGAQSGTMEALLPGMILSNEPGYYKAGEFGIRIENLVLTEVRDIAGADAGEWYGFENLTWVPIDRTLIEPALLSNEERDWLDAYHAEMRALLAPQMNGEVLAWLEEQTRPL